MRDPNRIPEILEMVKQLWLRCPDQRFWQFLSNLGGDVIEKLGFNVHDMWYIEDEDTVKAIEALLQEGK